MLINRRRWLLPDEPEPCPGPQPPQPVACCGHAEANPREDWDRRAFLRFSLGALASLTLPLDLAWGQPPDPASPRARACILLWLEGGPSHVDTFDPKPGNGTFRAIDTAAPGVQISEHFPRLAERMGHVALVRSFSTTEGNHQRARYLVHTGYAPTPTLTHPSLGSIVSAERGNPQSDLPNFIAIQTPSHGPGFLGAAHAPFVIQNPTQPIANLERPRGVEPARFDARVRLVNRLDEGFRQRHPGRDVEAHTTITARAVRFMNSRLTAAFDLEREPQQVREAYGPEGFGQGVLMARRLVQAGVPFVEVALGGWDTHEDNFTRTAALSEQLDAAFSALLDDLARFEILDQVLVVALGEFGRTPRINARDGRDHWPQAWSAAFAGGGIRGGQAIGATDAEGAEVIREKLGVPDLVATVCQAMAVDHTRWNMTPVGRPLQIADGGRAIPGLLRPV